MFQTSTSILPLSVTSFPPARERTYFTQSASTRESSFNPDDFSSQRARTLGRGSRSSFSTVSTTAHSLRQSQPTTGLPTPKFVVLGSNHSPAWAPGDPTGPRWDRKRMSPPHATSPMISKSHSPRSSVLPGRTVFQACPPHHSTTVLGSGGAPLLLSTAHRRKRGQSFEANPTRHQHYHRHNQPKGVVQCGYCERVRPVIGHECDHHAVMQSPDGSTVDPHLHLEQRRLFEPEYVIDQTLGCLCMPAEATTILGCNLVNSMMNIGGLCRNFFENVFRACNRGAEHGLLKMEQKAFSNCLKVEAAIDERFPPPIVEGANLHSGCAIHGRTAIYVQA